MASRPQLYVELLTDDSDLRDLCEQYWAIQGAHFRHSVADIAHRHGKTTKETIKLALQYSRAFRYHCPQCSKPRTYARGRSILVDNPGRDLPSQLCEDCEHARWRMPAQPRASSTSPSHHLPLPPQRSEQTSLSAADVRRAEQAALKAQAEQKRQIIRKAFPPITPPYLDPRTLAFEDAVALLSLLRAGGSEDFSIIEPVSSYAIPFTPSSEMDGEVLRHLIDQALIEAHPDSALDAFILNEDSSDVDGFYTQDIMYYPLIGPDLAARRQWVAELENIFRLREWPAEWQQSWAPLWKRIALHECLDYLRIVLTEHKLPFQAGEKTRLVLEQALDDFSAAQVFNMTWQAAKEAAAFYMRGGVTPQHAANTAIGGIQRRVERARNEKWDVHSFRRRFDRPISMTARVLFETAMQIGYAGFNERPGAIEPFSVVATTDTNASAQ